MKSQIGTMAIAALCALALPACKGGTTEKQPEKTPEAPKQPETPKQPAPAAGITPKDIPPGFDFPGDRVQIQAWADAWEIDKIVAKTWNLWGGMTAPSGEKWQETELPIWETWCGQNAAFAKECASMKRPGRAFKNAAQLLHAATKDTASGGTASGLKLVSFNKFNPAMAGYLAASHPGPGGGNFDYTSQTSLGQLNSTWPKDTPIADRKVAEAPYVPSTPSQQGTAAVELKPVLFGVKKTGLTPMPLWQGVAASKPSKNSNCDKIDQNCHPDPSLWTTCVLIDPTNTQASPDTAPVAATPDQIASANANATFSCETYLYAPISTIYYFAMDAAEAASFNQVQAESGLTVEAGDFAVLTAMHVNTKEIVNWTWATFWWQPGQDAPDDFPGSKKAMTDKVAGHWRNYAMCAAYIQTQGAASKDMVVCFNPYLETSSGIPDGMQSNCMSCHGTATVGSGFTENKDGILSIDTLSYPADYTQPIDFNNDPRFKDFTRTDFSWAIPGDSSPPANAP